MSPFFPGSGPLCALFIIPGAVHSLGCSQLRRFFASVMPKSPRIKLGETSLLHPAPVTVQQVMSPLLQSVQLCCLSKSLLTRRGWLCGAAPLDGFDMIGFGVGREVCALLCA